MKVNDPNSTAMNPDSIGGAGLDRAQQADAIGRRGGGGAGRVSGDATDTVSLSGLGNQLRRLSADSTERTGRMDKLSLSVESRSYIVDAMTLSHLLVEDALAPST